MSMYNKGSTDTVLDAINIENDITVNPLSLKNVGFGIPMAVSTPGATQNARVRVYGLMRQGYQGTVDIEYRRLALELLFENQTLLVQATGAKTLVDLLPAINATYATNFEKGDVVNVSVADLGDDYIVTLEAAASCLMWSGSVDIRVVKARPSLGSVVKAQELDLVNAPYSDAGKQRLEYVAWGYNFAEASTELVKYNARAADASLASVINGVVDLGIVFKNAGEVAMGEVNIKGATCYLVNADGFRTLEIRNITSGNWIGTLIIPWVAE